VVQENYKRFACTRCDFSITKIPGGRQLEVAEAEELLRERKIGPLQGFRSRLGRPFAAILKLTDEHKLEFDFGQGSGDDESSEPVDFGDQPSLGPCPKCSARVFEHGMSYVCEKSVGPSRSCDFRAGKIILQQEVAREQMSKLLAEGRTDLLQGFVSSRTRRKFKAYLVRGADGKIGVEFEPRPAKGGAAADKSSTAKGAAARKSAGSAGAEEAGADAVETTAAAKKAGAKTTKTAVAKKAAAKTGAAKTAAGATAGSATGATAAKKAAVKKAPAKKAAAGKTAGAKKTAAAGKSASRKAAA
jgi:DNA topoisomerase-3